MKRVIASAAADDNEAFDPFAAGALRVASTSGPQREIWSLAQLGAETSCAYNEGIVLRLHGALDVEALQRALSALIRRHDALRASFSPDGMEMVVAETVPLDLTVSDLSELAAGAVAAALFEIRQSQMRTPFDLIRGPLVRLQIVRTAADDVSVIMVAHHIVCDGWSFGVLIDDLAALYSLEASAPGATSLPAADSALDVPSVPPARERAALSFWSDVFKDGAPVLEIPCDRPRPRVRTFEADRVDRLIPADVLVSLRESSRGDGVTLFTTLCAAWAGFLARLSGSEDLVLGIAAAGQPALARMRMVGHAVTVLPVRFRIPLDAPLREISRDVHATLLDAFDHQDLSYGALLEALPLSRDPSRPPLVQVLFNLDRRVPLDAFDRAGISATVEAIPRLADAFELFLNLVETDEGLMAECQYNTALFDAAGMAARLEAFEELLRAMTRRESQSLTGVSLASASMRAKMQGWGRGVTRAIPSGTAADLVRAQARVSPDQIAVVGSDRSLTYRELDDAADRLAGALRRRGLGSGSRIGVWMERGSLLPVALLGIMRSGAAFVPLDPRQPASRVALILSDSMPAAILVDRQPPPPAREGMDALPLARLVAEPKDGEDCAMVDGEAPAYVLYTSGSTGRPKGVVVPHRALVNFLCAMQEAPGIHASDVLLAVTTLSFDISLLEILLPLTVGAQLHVADAVDAADGERLAQRLHSGVTVMQATPSGWRVLLAAGWRPQRPGFRAFCGGEALPADLAHELLDRGVELWNLYGPTEATVWATVTPVTSRLSLIPLGEAIANTQLCVLDDSRHPVPPGVPGELCIGGAALALGYLNAPAITDERFISIAEGGDVSGRWYRTGDLVRWLPDGGLLFEGRRDGQVKLRGHRVELGEVEAVARRHPDVDDAAASVSHLDPGDDRLTLWVVLRADATWSADSLDAFLREHLPDVMHPSFVGRLDALPMTANGKLDRRALPSPAESSPISDEPPATATERSVAAAFQEILGVPRAGRSGNFFSLGGHSLLAARLLQRIRSETGVTIPLRDFFAAPTVARVAAAVDSRHTRDSGGEEGSALAPRAWGTERPLSLTQERLWFVQLSNPDTTEFNLPSAFWLIGPLDTAALSAAFTRLVMRQDMLRSTIRDVAGQPRQVVAPSHDVVLTPEPMAGATSQERREAAREAAAAAAREPFDLTAGPLWRARLLEVDGGEHLLFFMPHHIVFDGWSFDVVLAELKAGLDAAAGTVPVLPKLEVTYADYAAWQRERVADRAIVEGVEAGRARLEGAPLVLELATDRPRPAVRRGDGDWVPFSLSAEASRAMRHFASETGTTPYLVLLAAFAAVLSRSSGQDDLLIGTPVRGREAVELEALVGFFVNTLVVRVRTSASATANTLLRRVRAEVFDAMQHAEVPFDLVVRELHSPRDLSRTPLFQAFFSFQDVRNRSSSMGALEVRQEVLFAGSAATDITLWVRDDGQEISGALEYDVSLFDRWRIEALARHIDTMILRMATAPDAPLTSLALLDEVDAEVTDLALNSPESVPEHPCVLRQIGDVAAARTGDPAVTFGERTLSYGELWDLSGRVANGLRRLALPPHALVAISSERDERMPSLLLGIWRASAAYLPLDAEQPASRLRAMLEQARVDLIVTSGADLPPDSISGERVVTLEELLEADGADAPAFADADDLAYVIFTSGSTGLPKGVEITHRALRWFLAASGGTLPVGPTDVMLAVTTLTFDIAILELLLPLMAGGRVVVANAETSYDGRELGRLIDASGATAMQGTPSTWRMLLDDGWTGRLRTILAGGESLSRQLASELLLHANQVWNLYGPTEATVWATAAQVVPSPEPVTIGRPLPWAWAAIVDDTMQPVLPGRPGELLLGGPGLARGYRNRQDLTVERFVSWQDDGGKTHRMYRTGDLARIRGHAEIEHLGRNDHQVKIRGFRVELGEVEHALAQLSGVAQCVMDVRSAPNGVNVLVAYVTFKDDRQLTGSDMRRHMQRTLPEYMIPSHFVAVDAMPLTSNGKVDRRALPSPFGANGGTADAATPPRTETESTIAEVWGAVLEVAFVGRNDNFFDRGGYSLLSLQAIAQLERRLGRRAPLALMLTGTVAELAQWFDGDHTQ